MKIIKNSANLLESTMTAHTLRARSAVHADTSYSDYIIRTLWAVPVASSATYSSNSQPAAGGEHDDGETSAS